MFRNVVVGTPLVEPFELLAASEKDWEENEEGVTLFTSERSLPRILKEAGVVNSTSEVRKNRKDLVIDLNEPDFMTVKWGKQRLFILVGT